MIFYQRIDRQLSIDHPCVLGCLELFFTIALVLSLGISFFYRTPPCRRPLSRPTPDRVPWAGVEATPAGITRLVSAILGAGSSNSGNGGDAASEPTLLDFGSFGSSADSWTLSFLAAASAAFIQARSYLSFSTGSLATAASIRTRHPWLCASPGLRFPLCALSHAGHPAVYPCFSRFFWVIHKFRVPGSSRNGSGSRTSASGTSALSDSGLSNQLPLLPPARSHATPLTFFNKAPSQRANSGFLRRLTTQWIPSGVATAFSVVFLFTPTKIPGCQRAPILLFPPRRNSTNSPQDWRGTLHAFPFSLWYAVMPSFGAPLWNNVRRVAACSTSHVKAGWSALNSTSA